MVYDLADLQLSEQHERLLRETVIDENGPGTILRDFGAFLTYVEGEEVPLTGTHQLRGAVLPDLNARLSRPLEIGLTRPVQKSYPHVNGLYLLLRASGLTLVEGHDRKPILVVDRAVKAMWDDMNPTERYCTLLESWLVRADPQIINEGRRGSFGIPNTLPELLLLFRRLAEQGPVLQVDKDEEQMLRYFPGLHNLALAELFGMVAIQHGPAETGKGWHIETVQRTPWGEAIVAMLVATVLEHGLPFLDLEPEDAMRFGVLQSALQPYFPAWQKNLAIPETAPREGTHIFKVSLGKIWRRIAMPSDLTLEPLARVILRAVEFDYDHLYEFTYRNRFGGEMQAHHEYMDEGLWADEVAIGDLPLHIGETMGFLYDFGDEWQFKVVLERIDHDMAVTKPVILEEHGKAPEQYRW